MPDPEPLLSFGEAVKAAQTSRRPPRSGSSRSLHSPLGQLGHPFGKKAPLRSGQGSVRQRRRGQPFSQSPNERPLASLNPHHILTMNTKEILEAFPQPDGNILRTIDKEACEKRSIKS